MFASFLSALRSLFARWRAHPHAPPPRVPALEDARGRRYPVGAELIVGRDPNSGLVIDPARFGPAAESVSARHARVFRDPALGYLVEDLDSLNGVWIGEAPTHLHPLRDGDTVSLGEVRLTFRDSSQPRTEPRS